MSIKLTKIFNGISWQDPEDILVYNGISWESVQAVKVFNGISWDTVWEPGTEAIASFVTIISNIADSSTARVFIEGPDLTLYEWLTIIPDAYTNEWALDELQTWAWPGQVYANNSAITAINFHTTEEIIDTSWHYITANVYVGNVLVGEDVTYNNYTDNPSNRRIEVEPLLTVGDLFSAAADNTYANITLTINGEWITNSNPVTSTFTSNAQIHIDKNQNSIYRTGGISNTDYYVEEDDLGLKSGGYYRIDDTQDYGLAGIDFSSFLPNSKDPYLLTGTENPWDGWAYEVELVAYTYSNAASYVFGANAAGTGDVMSGTISSAYYDSEIGDAFVANAHITYNSLRSLLQSKSLTQSTFLVKTVITDGDGNKYYIYRNRNSIVDVRISDYNFDN